MNKWPVVRLESLADFKNGLNFSSENRGRGLKVIGVADFQDHFYPEYEALEEINPNGVVRDTDYLEEKDIVFVRSNGNRDLIGRSLFITGLTERISHSGFTIRLRFHSDKVFHAFYAYVFKSSLMRALLSVYGGGTNINNLNQRILKNLYVPLPPVSTQQKIAAVLSAYDELIENNRRRITLLEKMAEEIYREWFVRLRFPSHETVKTAKGVPEGWSFEKASTLFGLVKGKSYAGDEISDDPEHMPFISLKSFNRGGGYREDGLKHYAGQYKEEQVVRQNDVVMALTDMTQDRAVVGQVARVPDVGAKGAVISLDAVKLIPIAVNNTFLYCYMRHSGFGGFIKEFANGTNVLHLKSELVTQQRITAPPRYLQDAFAAKADPIYKAVDAITAANSLLTKLRDTLLPRLISGKLSVEDIAIQFPASMAEESKAEPGVTAHA